MLFPSRAECKFCGRMVRIKWWPQKRVPTGLDGVGTAKCPACLSSAFHFAGGTPERIAEVATMMNELAGGSGEISLTERATGKDAGGLVDGAEPKEIKP
jgi:hypothetical protein